MSEIRRRLGHNKTPAAKLRQVRRTPLPIQAVATPRRHRHPPSTWCRQSWSLRSHRDFSDSAKTSGIIHAAVVLRVTVTTDGKVADPEVVEAAGQGFDEAATEAALSYQFAPARRGEQALAARILLRVEFHLPEPETEAALPAPVAVAPIPAPTSPPSAVPSAPAPLPEASTTAVEVTVKGYSEADRLRRSAEAVNVVETTQAKQRTADLGEVLARTQGIGVQRSGGLGSDTRVSLNGLTDDQIRFFVDGVPLEFMGFPFGLANVPVNLVDRVEIYRGVVPNRFGADALGGAVNLVTDQDIAEGTHGSTSVQAGSFGTYRLTLGGHHRDLSRGTFGRVSGFLDRADNNYPMDDVKVPDSTGVAKPMRVYRFHDAYHAQGASIEVGALDQPWARKLVLRAFITRYAKEIQHNLLMTFNPYGDVELREESKGATLRYENVLARRVLVKVLAGYANRKTDYEDLGNCTYNWLGQCIRQRPQPGERTGRAADQEYWEHNFFARVNGDWHFATDQSLRLSLSPTLTRRSAKENRLANLEARDPYPRSGPCLDWFLASNTNSTHSTSSSKMCCSSKTTCRRCARKIPCPTGRVSRDAIARRTASGSATLRAMRSWTSFTPKRRTSGPRVCRALTRSLATPFRFNPISNSDPRRATTSTWVSHWTV